MNLCTYILKHVACLVFSLDGPFQLGGLVSIDAIYLLALFFFLWAFFLLGKEEINKILTHITNVFLLSMFWRKIVSWAFFNYLFRPILIKSMRFPLTTQIYIYIFLGAGILDNKLVYVFSSFRKPSLKGIPRVVSKFLIILSLSKHPIYKDHPLYSLFPCLLPDLLAAVFVNAPFSRPIFTGSIKVLN